MIRVVKILMSGAQRGWIYKIHIPGFKRMDYFFYMPAELEQKLGKLKQSSAYKKK